MTAGFDPYFINPVIKIFKEFYRARCAEITICKT